MKQLKKILKEYINIFKYPVDSNKSQTKFSEKFNLEI